MTNYKIETVTVAETAAGGNILDAGTYHVQMPADYNPTEVTGVDILMDDALCIVTSEETRYLIECRHASGSSRWDVEPECNDLSYDEAERIMATLEPTDDDGAPLEYRIVEA